MRRSRMDGYREHWGTRFPHPPARRRVWEGYALTQGDRETRFPHPLARRRVWEGYALPRRTSCHPVRVRRSRMDG